MRLSSQFCFCLFLVFIASWVIYTYLDCDAKIGSIWCRFQFCKNHKIVRREVWACEDIKSVWAKHERCEDIVFTTNQFLQVLSCQIKNNTPPHLEGELKFQMQAMTQMMERMNFVMGNVCDRLDRVEKHGNVAGTCTQEVRKVGAEPKSNSGNRVERPRWADYEDFEEVVDDIGDGGLIRSRQGQIRILM